MAHHHSLCFTDLCIGASSNGTACDGSSDGGTAALLVREENKKSSFALKHPYKLNDHNTSDHDHKNNGNGGSMSTKDHTQVDNDSRKNESSSTAIASISSCISNTDNSENETIHFTTTHTQEVFLFGGFELLANVKTVEVHVVRPNDTEETYLTTCKGVPIRDLAPLSAPPRYIDDGIEGEAKAKETSDESAVSGEEEDQDIFYKFILVSPGGAKPVTRVRLKFVRSNTLKSANGIRSIIVHTLKVKGRLSDSISTSKVASQEQSSIMAQQTSNMSVASANISSVPNNDMNSLASMMAMMGGGSNGFGSMPMAMQMSPQLLKEENIQSSNQQQYMQQQQQQQQQHNNHQAEITSSIAGLGIFLKSSEERTFKKLETLISDMEMRIMKRLDTLTERLDVIEQSINRKETDDNDDNEPDSSNHT